MKDTIYRADAIDAVRKIVPVETEIDSTLLDKAEVIVELFALPSAETPTADEKHQLSEETPTNALTDLISRADAIEAIIAQRAKAELSDYNFALGLAEDAIRHLPSAEATCATCADRAMCIMSDDGNWKACKGYKSDQYKKGFEDAKRAFELEYARESENMRKRNAELEVMLNAQKAISAEAEGRHYIKIYADDEPSVKAEKLYQICGETQNGEVAEWLKEYFPSAEPKTGEWIDKGNWMGFECSRCKCHSRYVTPFCPQCGARMKGGEDG